MSNAQSPTCGGVIALIDGLRVKREAKLVHGEAERLNPEPVDSVPAPCTLTPLPPYIHTSTPS